MSTMLYKYPGAHEIHGGKFDYLVVDHEDGDDEPITAALADGWTLTTPEAKAAHFARLESEAAQRERAQESKAAERLADEKPPSRDELEQMATSLGLPFSARVSDKKLGSMIAAASQG